MALTTRGRLDGRDEGDVAREYLAKRGRLDSLIAEFGLDDPRRDYAVAGSFVSYLLEQHGIQPLIDFLQGCGSDASRYEAALRSAYGVGLGELEWGWSRWLARHGDTVQPEWYEPQSWPQALRNASVSRSRAAASRRAAPVQSPTDGGAESGSRVAEHALTGVVPPRASVVADVPAPHEDK